VNFEASIARHRRSLFFLFTLLVVGGALSGFRLPVALFPTVAFPRVVVSLDAGDRPAERMAIEVTWPVEDAVHSVPGVRTVRSTSSRGSSEISVNFGWGEDMVAAMLQVESSINQILPTLPPGTRFHVRRMDPTVFPVLAYSLTSDSRSLVELHDLAQYQIRPLLSTVGGVARVAVLGGAQEEFRVTVNPDRLSAYGLALSDVAKALSAANVITAVGRLEDHYKLYLVLSDTRLADMEQIRDTVLFTGPNGIVRLEDVAVVSRGTVPQWSRVTADGRDAVSFQVYQQPGGNTVRIAREVKAKLAAFGSQLPSGVRLANWYDQSDLIVASATSVRDAVLLGAALAALVLLVFLRDFKITAIAVVCVPAALAVTVLLLLGFNLSFNIMTLGGMAAAVGLIIDDAIVMVEHIARRRAESGRATGSVVLAAAREFTRPLVASSACTIVIFAPLPFLSGVTGAFFKALSLTVAASLVISFLLAWLVVPLLADRWLSSTDAQKVEGRGGENWVQRIYGRLLRRLLVRPVLVLVGLVPLVLAAWFGYRHVGSGFMPAMDEGGFILDYRAAAGTSLTEADRLLRQVEAILRATPEVQTYSRRTGLQLGGGLTESNEGDFFVRLHPPPRRPIDQIMEDVRGRVEQTVPGLKIEMAQLMEDLIGDLTAVPQPIEVKLYSDDGEQLRLVAARVAAAIGQIPGVVDVRDGIVLAGDALNIEVDRVKVSLEGMDAEAVTRVVADYLTGIVTTEIQRGPKMVGVRVWPPAEVRATDRDVEALQIRAPDGHLFPLRRVAKVSAVAGQPQIMRDDLKRFVAVTGRINGRDLGSTIRDVERTMAQSDLLPAGVYYRLGGTFEQQRAAFTALAGVFAAAVALVFLLLLFVYERVRVALAMVFCALLGLCAVFIGLWITGTEMNISTMMGMTMAVGIAAEVAIFYVSELAEQPRSAGAIDAFIAAGKNRMRPIAMTTLAAILALSPLAFGIGQGSAMQQPLAIAIIFGLMAQLPLMLVVLPVLLSVLKIGPIATNSAENLPPTAS